MNYKCDYCRDPATLVKGKKIYPHRPDLYELFFWECEPCKAYVGTHKNNPKHKRLGRLANAELRQAKKRAHFAFDPLWRRGDMNRREAYKWISEELQILPRYCHIGMFNLKQCKKLIKICNNRNPTINTNQSHQAISEMFDGDEYLIQKYME